MSRSGYAQRIRARANELRQIIADAQAELDELEVAERVLNRLTADQDETQDQAPRRVRHTKEPTIADMAVKFLGEVGPMATNQLLEHMRQNWRDDLRDTTLTSTLSRTKNAGRIKYEDGMWHVANSTEDPDPQKTPADAGEGEAEGTDTATGFLQLQPSPTEAHEKGVSHVASRFESNEP